MDDENGNMIIGNAFQRRQGLYICKKFVEEMHGNITAYYKEDTLNIKIDFMSGGENSNIQTIDVITVR